MCYCTAALLHFERAIATVAAAIAAHAAAGAEGGNGASHLQDLKPSV
jgi:hypothetical protein